MWIIIGHQAYYRSYGLLINFNTGRGAFQLRRRCVVRHAGAAGKENVGISNDNAGGKPAHRKTKVS